VLRFKVGGSTCFSTSEHFLPRWRQKRKSDDVVYIECIPLSSVSAKRRHMRSLAGISPKL